MAAPVDPAFSVRLHKSNLPWVLWAASIALAAGLVWIIAGVKHEREVAASAARTSAAISDARSAAIAEAMAAIPPIPEHLDLRQPSGVRSTIEIIKSDPGERSRAEAVALGRQWQQKRFEELTKFAAELRRSPSRLDDAKVRAQALEFVADRLTERVMLETLAELSTPRASDLLYAVWIGSKDRNETTQLAEALLLSKDVRKGVSGALEVALALREKPTDCAQIQRLVDRAIHEGDRRASNLLVTTSARQNCGASGAEDCVKCLGDVKDMRKAIRATAARPDPV